MQQNSIRYEIIAGACVTPLITLLAVDPAVFACVHALGVLLACHTANFCKFSTHCVAHKLQDQCGSRDSFSWLIVRQLPLLVQCTLMHDKLTLLQLCKSCAALFDVCERVRSVMVIPWAVHVRAKHNPLADGFCEFHTQSVYGVCRCRIPSRVS